MPILVTEKLKGYVLRLRAGGVPGTSGAGGSRESLREGSRHASARERRPAAMPPDGEEAGAYLKIFRRAL